MRLSSTVIILSIAGQLHEDYYKIHPYALPNPFFTNKDYKLKSYDSAENNGNCNLSFKQ